jgi:putative tryptophan/tyrosine transport system substrate-binding protein
MRRRDSLRVIAGLAAWPLAARAQQATTTVIGYLSIRSPATDAPLLASFRQGLSQGEFREGQNVAIEYRYAEGQLERLRSLIADLVQRQVAVIVTTGSAEAGLAAKAATTTIPVVFSTGGDPVREGLVASLNRPEGNLTGVTTSFAEAASKRLGIIREILAGDTIAGLLINPADTVPARFETENMLTAATSAGQKLEILQAVSSSQIDEVFASLADLRVGALLLAPHALFATRATQLVVLSARYRVPTMYWRREFVDAGGLMSYGSSLADALRLLGTYCARILRGEKPGDLPVQQPTKFELIINASTAKALGLDLPPTLLARADEVID